MRKSTVTKASWKKCVNLRLGGKRLAAYVLLLGLLFFSGSNTGCSSVELEEKCFPMMVALDYDKEKQQVGFAYLFSVLRAEPDAVQMSDTHASVLVYAQTVEEARTAFERTLNKVPDYNHLKICLFSESFLEEYGRYGDFLKEIRRETTFPRNTYACVTADVRNMLSVSEGLSEDLGSYIEEMLENHEYGKDVHLPTLGRLMDDAVNQRTGENLPLLEAENGVIEWTGFFELRE